MSKKVVNVRAGRREPATRAEVELPEEVTVALCELAGAAREGLLALAVATGLQVMHTIMQEDVTGLCGPKGRHAPDRAAVRHGTEAGSVVLGGRRVPVRRPRVRGVGDAAGEVPVPAYEHFSQVDVLETMAVERMLAGLSTRRYGVGLEPVGEAVEAAATSTSKSAVSRRFVQATERALGELVGRDLTGLDVVAVMIDGVHFAEHLCVVALGVTNDGTKVPLGLVEGATENTTVVTGLLEDLRDRGLDVTRPVLVCIDGAKALRSAVRRIFDRPVIQRCQLHKIRNVEDHLPERLRPEAARRMREAHRQDSHLEAKAKLERLAKDLERTHPGAAASVREGLDETLTVLRLGLPPSLRSTFRSTNAVESMISIARDHSRNVKRWRGGQMALRWCAAGMLEAEKQFRRVKGHRHLPELRQILEHQFAETIDNKAEAA